MRRWGGGSLKTPRRDFDFMYFCGGKFFKKEKEKEIFFRRLIVAACGCGFANFALLEYFFI